MLAKLIYMARIESISAETKKKYEDSELDRALVFETQDEFELLRLAAKARIAHRKEKSNKPFKNDVYLTKLPDDIKRLFTSTGWIEQHMMLIEDFAETGYGYCGIDDEFELDWLRVRAADFVAEVQLANTAFEEAQTFDEQTFFQED